MAGKFGHNDIWPAKITYIPKHDDTETTMPMFDGHMRTRNT